MTGSIFTIYGSRNKGMNNKKIKYIMKKIALLFFTAVMVVFGSSVASAQGKYGPDSTECIKYLSYYKEYYKQKNYKESLPNWRKAFKLCPPTANQTMLADGTSLMRYLINLNKNNVIYKEALIDSLMMLHDIRLEYYPKYSSRVLNNKALDMINYMQDDVKKLYAGLSDVIAKNGENTSPQVFLFQLNSAVSLFKDGIMKPEEVMVTYESALESINKIEAATPEEKKADIVKLRSDLENIFITSKVAQCDDLIALFTPRFEAAPEDADLALNIVKMMSLAENCLNNDLFVKAATTVYKNDPSHTSAYFLYKVYASMGEVENANKMMQEAIDFEESDSEQDADYYYELAAFNLKNGNTSAAYADAEKAAQLDADGSIKGKAYMLAGTIWGSTVCKGNEIEIRAPYWVAVDFLVKAKNADPTLAEDCDKLIAQYKAYYPQTAEAFMYDVTDGQSYTVSCNGMRATTTVRTQK